MLIFVIILAIGLGFGILFALRYTSRRAIAISEAHFESFAFMNECESRLLAMKRSHPDHDKLLGALHELVKYSDKSGTSELDWKIDPVLTRLEVALTDTASEDVATVVSEATLLFENRREEIRASKRGSF